MKHVCSHELHTIGKCGCECYSETDGEDEDVLKNAMGSSAYSVLQHVRITRKAHKDRPDEIAYPRGYASPLLADGTRAHISTGHMDQFNEDHRAWEAQGQFHLVDRTHFSMLDTSADPVIDAGSASSASLASGSIGGSLLGTGGILGAGGGSIGASSTPAGGSVAGASSTPAGAFARLLATLPADTGGAGSAGVGTNNIAGSTGSVSSSASGGSLLGSGGVLGAGGGSIGAGSIEEP